FADALRLARRVNASAVQQLFQSRIGKQVTTDEIRAAFDAAFGQGTGQRVRVSCANHTGRRLIVELTVGIAGDITPDSDIGRLILASSPTDSGCPGGLVDPAGLQ